MNRKNKKAFTLIEIMVVIVLIMIFFLGIRSLNFSQKTNEQNAEVFANKIISQLENNRNDVLFGKAEVSGVNEGKRVAEREIKVNKTENKVGTVGALKNEKIEKVYCNGDDSKTINNNFNIVFKSNSIEIQDSTTNNILKCSSSFLTKLNILVGLNGQNFEIEIDTVSGLIKKTKK